MLAAVLWYSLLWLPAVLAAAALCALLLTFLYRPQLRPLSRFWRFSLPGLRFLAIAALLASVLRPVILRPARPEDLGAVVVLLDRSASMGVLDSSWTPAELVSLADALHALPPEVQRQSLAPLVAELAHIRSLVDDAARAASELEYARLSGRGVDSAARHASSTQAALLAACNQLAARQSSLPAPLQPAAHFSDAEALLKSRGRDAFSDLRSRVDAQIRAVEAYQTETDAALYAANEVVRAVCDGLARQSRAQLGLRAIDDALLPRLGPRVPLAAFSFGATLSPVPVNPPAREAAAISLSTPPDADRSDLAAALRQLGQRLHNRAVQAVVLVTDGRPVASDPVPAPVAPGLRGSPPILALRCTPALVKDLTIGRIDLPASPFVGEPATVHVELSGTGYRGSSVSVTLASGDASRTLKGVIDDHDSASLDFPVRFDQPGSQQLTVHVDPLPGEASLANNSAQRWVKVLSQRVRVAAFARAGVPDFDLLASALSRSPSVSLTYAAVPPGQAPPISARQILQQQVLILSDLGAESLTADQSDAVRSLVAEHGGTLILVAGEAHWPLDSDAEALMSDLLPYRSDSLPSWRLAPGQDAYFRPVPSPDAASLEALRLSDAAVPPAQQWAQLPPIHRYLRLGDLKPDVRVLLVEHESGSPILTESRLGAGRILTLATDETWRWAKAPNLPDAADRFWRHLVRYATDEPYAAEDSGYALDADAVSVSAGQSLHLRAKIPAEAAGGSSRAPLVQVLARDAVLRSQPLTLADPAVSGRYDATLPGLPGGDYRLRLVAGPADETTPVPEMSLHVASPMVAELADLSPDNAYLHRLADPTGGRVIPLADASRLASEILRHRAERPKTIEYALWDSPYLFVFVVACLSAEWSLRKRLGLA